MSKVEVGDRLKNKRRTDFFKKNEDIVLTILVLAYFLSTSTIIPYIHDAEYFEVRLIINWFAFLSFYFLAYPTVKGSKRLKLRWILLYWIVGVIALKFSPLEQFNVQMNWWIFGPAGYFVGLVVFDRKSRCLHASAGEQTTQNSITTSLEGPDGSFKTTDRIVANDVAKLNGEEVTRITFTHHGRVLEIAGGQSNQYVAYYSEDPADDASWYVYDRNLSSNETDEVQVLIGQVTGYMPSSVVIPTAKAQQLAQEFKESGRIILANNWSNSGPMAGGLRPSD